MEQFAEELKSHLHDLGFTAVQQIIIQRTPDWSGDDALFVWLLQDDDAPEGNLKWEHVQRLKEAAQKMCEEHFPDLYPYVRTRRVAEWQEIVNA